MKRLASAIMAVFISVGSLIAAPAGGQAKHPAQGKSAVAANPCTDFRMKLAEAAEAVDEAINAVFADDVVYDAAEGRARAKVSTAVRLASAPSEESAVKRMAKAMLELGSCRAGENSHLRTIRFENSTKMIGLSGFARIEEERRGSIEYLEAQQSAAKKLGDCSDHARQENDAAARAIR